MVLFPLKIHTILKIMTRGLIFTCEKYSTDSELFHSEWFFLGFSSGGEMRGARPGIRTNLIIMLGSVWWNVLRSGGLLVMLVDMFCLGSIYTVNTRQVYLSPDLGTISLMEILPPCLSLLSLQHLKHQSISFVFKLWTTPSQSELGRRGWGLRWINKSGSGIYLINLTKLCIEFK